MSRRLVVRPLAEKDIEAASKWYDQQRSGLGLELIEAIEAKLCAIGERPESFPLDLRFARRALVDRFPYAVYFIVSADTISIIGVIHVSRDKPNVLGARVEL